MNFLKHRAIGVALLLLSATANDAQSQILTSVTPDFGPTLGGLTLQIAGTDFGAAQGSGGVTVGGTDCTDVIWSAVLVECTLPPGQGAMQPVELTTDLGLTSNTLPFDYDAPVLTNIDPTSGPDVGGNTLTLTGSNLGVSGSVTVGGVPCSSATHNHSQVTCTVPPGTGIQPVAISVSGQPSGTLPYEYIPSGPPVPALSFPAQILLVMLLGLSVVIWTRTRVRPARQR